MVRVAWEVDDVEALALDVAGVQVMVGGVIALVGGGLHGVIAYHLFVDGATAGHHLIVMLAVNHPTPMVSMVGAEAEATARVTVADTEE